MDIKKKLKMNFKVLLSISEEIADVIWVFKNIILKHR